MKIDRRMMLGGLASATALTAWAIPGSAADRAPASALRVFLDACFDARVRADPQLMAAYGLPGREDELGLSGSAAAQHDAALARRQLAALRARFTPAGLSASEQVSYRLFEREQLRLIANARWWAHYYPISGVGNPAASLVEFLISGHPVKTASDAEHYVARLAATDNYLAAVAADFDTIGRLDLAPPQAVFPPALASARALLAGPPFDGAGSDQALWANLKAKLAAAGLDVATRDRLLAQAKAALLGPFRRGMTTYIAATERLATHAHGNDGLWSKPGGAAFYAWLLRNSTTTDLSADAIHRIGLDEVARIRGRIDALRGTIGDAPSVDALLAYLRQAPTQRFPAGGAGRAVFLTEANAFVAAIARRLGEAFYDPPAKVPEVRAVPAWQGDATAFAFFKPATPGRDAAIFFNLAHIERMLRPQVEATVYHEGVPGHALQAHYLAKLTGLPRFRSAGSDGGVYYDAWYEGWAVYAEGLAEEMGQYHDPVSRIGRLTSELFRGARLVVDTGLHAKRWTREQATDYLFANSLMDRDAAQREIDRYLSFPGQATSYKIGQLKIVELREAMRRRRGAAFDIRDFHRAFFQNGPLPLDMLAETIAAQAG